MCEDINKCSRIFNCSLSNKKKIIDVWKSDGSFMSMHFQSGIRSC